MKKILIIFVILFTIAVGPSDVYVAFKPKSIEWTPLSAQPGN